jgi:hypothetical protein
MDQNDDGKVPLFKTWMQWYIFVIAFLLLLIIAFWLFTKYFS